jgi:hypothetical protein
MSIVTITLAEAVQKLYDHRHGNTGHAFSVTFIKRTSGEARTMNARFGVRVHLKGGTLPYLPKEHNLMGCFDLKLTPEGYRMINLETITGLKMEGVEYVVKG